MQERKRGVSAALDLGKCLVPGQGTGWGDFCLAMSLSRTSQTFGGFHKAFADVPGLDVPHCMLSKDSNVIKKYVSACLLLLDGK